MFPTRLISRSLSLALVWTFFSVLAFAQGFPTTVQVFMPSGGPPPGTLRLSLVRDDGFMDTVFTDQKGKFDMPTPTTQTANYTVTVESDGANYDTTTATLNIQRNQPVYLTIYLKPFSSSKKPVREVLDVTTLERNIPQKASAAYKRAMTFIGAGQFESAITELQAAIKLYPEYARAFNDLGVLYMKLDRLDEAATTFRKAAEISKRFIYPRMNLGMVFNRQEKFKEAVEILGPLYEENHGMLEVRLAYANALSGAGEIVEAEKIYRPVLQLKDVPPATMAIVHFKMGYGLSRQGKFAEAVTAFDNVVALSPDLPNVHMHLGGALMQLQQGERAEKELLRAYELGGSSVAGAQLLLGHLYYSQKKLPEAQKAFEQYLKDLPTAPNAAQITQLLATLKAAPKN